MLVKRDEIVAFNPATSPNDAWLNIVTPFFVKILFISWLNVLFPCTRRDLQEYNITANMPVSNLHGQRSTHTPREQCSHYVANTTPGSPEQCHTLMLQSIRQNRAGTLPARHGLSPAQQTSWRYLDIQPHTVTA